MNQTKRFLKKSKTDGQFLERAQEAQEINNIRRQSVSTTQANEVKVICMNCMAMVNDHCTARCPKIKCKLCSKFGHVKRDCPRLKSKIKDYTKEKHEKDNDLIVYWGGHCDVCKQGVRNLLAKKPLKPLKEFPPNSLTPPQGSPSLSRAETSAR